MSRLDFRFCMDEEVCLLLLLLWYSRGTETLVSAPLQFYAGRSGLAVACLTAVREVPGSNRAVGSCVYRKSHCDLRAVCTLPAVPRSTQPSTLRGLSISAWLIARKLFSYCMLNAAPWLFVSV